MIIVIQCVISNAVVFTNELATLHNNTVNTQILIAISTNNLFLLIPLNKLSESVLVLNPLNTAMKHNNANLAVIPNSSVPNILAIGDKIKIPYNAINPTVVTAILCFAPE